MILGRYSCAALLLLGVASPIRSCGTKVVGVFHDPSFDYATLQEEKMAVGGVVYSVGPQEVRTLIGDEATNRLQFELLRNREDLDVLPAGAVLIAVGDEFYDKILFDYERGAMLSESHLEALREGLEGRARYVIFSRVEEDVVSRKRDLESQGDEEEKEETLKLTTSRRVTTSFRVYDVTGGKTVWRGLIQKSRSNEFQFGFRSGDETDEAVWIDLVVGTVIEDPSAEPVYPDPPDLNQVLGPIFVGFADHLPRLDES
jgi:hypothetical protein